MSAAIRQALSVGVPASDIAAIGARELNAPLPYAAVPVSISTHSPSLCAHFARSPFAGVSGQQHGLVALDADGKAGRKGHSPAPCRSCLHCSSPPALGSPVVSESSGDVRSPQVIRPCKLWCDLESAAEAAELSQKLGRVPFLPPTDSPTTAPRGHCGTHQSNKRPRGTHAAVLTHHQVEHSRGLHSDQSPVAEAQRARQLRPAENRPAAARLRKLQVHGPPGDGVRRRERHGRAGPGV